MKTLKPFREYIYIYIERLKTIFGAKEEVESKGI